MPPEEPWGSVPGGIDSTVLTLAPPLWPRVQVRSPWRTVPKKGTQPSPGSPHTGASGELQNRAPPHPASGAFSPPPVAPEPRPRSALRWHTQVRPLPSHLWKLDILHSPSGPPHPPGGQASVRAYRKASPVPSRPKGRRGSQGLVSAEFPEEIATARPAGRISNHVLSGSPNPNRGAPEWKSHGRRVQQTRLSPCSVLSWLDDLGQVT